MCKQRFTWEPIDGLAHFVRHYMDCELLSLCGKYNKNYCLQIIVKRCPNDYFEEIIFGVLGGDSLESEGASRTNE
jgi:hypothetical protein